MPDEDPMEAALELARPVAQATSAEWALIDAAVAGDANAFAGIYDRYARRVFGYLLYRVGTRADAEDLMQQVFLEAFGSIKRYKRTGAPFSAWLLTIAHHAAVSYRRRARPVAELSDALELRDDSPEGDPEAETLSLHDRMAVRRAVLRLPPEQQQVVTMRCLEQLEYADIAAAMGKPEGTVRVILHRALKALRPIVQQEMRQ